MPCFQASCAKVLHIIYWDCSSKEWIMVISTSLKFAILIYSSNRRGYVYWARWHEWHKVAPRPKSRWGRDRCLCMSYWHPESTGLNVRKASLEFYYHYITQSPWWGTSLHYPFTPYQVSKAPSPFLLVCVCDI